MYNKKNIIFYKSWSISISIILILSTILLVPNTSAESAFSLKINCGGPTVIDGSTTWEAGSTYVTGGSDYTFSTSSVDTTTNSIAEPVPPLDVYKKCRHTSPHTYSIPSVPDGYYVVRIHWTDQAVSAGLRDIDYDIEGVRVLEDWDIYAEAGGTFIAIDKEFEVTVSDGNGMQIVSSAATGDAFESAIEITSVEEEPSCPEHMIHYWKLNETSGSTYLDSYGDLDGSAINIPTPAVGLINGAQDFDGTSEYITVADDDSLDWGSTDSFTIELWANFTNAASKNKVMIGRDQNGGVHWWLGANQPTGITNWNMKGTDGSGIAVTGTTSINDGEWHHIVAVRNESTNKNRLYVDGVEEANATYDYTAGFDATTTLGIGYMAYHGTPDYYYDGLLDEIALYDSALNASIIQQHYTNGLNGLEYCKGEQPGPEPAPPVKIMPLGDSITVGSGSINIDGYRKSLYENLTDDGYNVDFVGSQTNGVLADTDHEGHGGWRDDQIATNIYNNGGSNWISTYTPDIILLHIGTNGLNSDPGDVEDILDEIDEYEADNDVDVTVVLARIINRVSYSSTTTDFNDNVEEMARDRVENSSNPAYPDNIVFVDMEDGAGIIYAEDSTPPFDDGDMNDNVHPNDAGYEKMAMVWLTAIEGLFNPSVSNVVLTASSPDNSTDDNLTCRYTLSMTADTTATAWTKDGTPIMTLYMPMEGGSANALKDYSGNGNDGTLVGNPTWSSTSGFDGNGSFYFDGDDSYIDAGSVMPTGAYTKTAWYKYEPGNQYNNIISGTDNHAFWVKDYSGYRLTAGHDGTWNQVEDPDTFPVNTWTFTAVTYDGSNYLRLYKNGEEVDYASDITNNF